MRKHGLDAIEAECRIDVCNSAVPNWRERGLWSIRIVHGPTGATAEYWGEEGGDMKRGRSIAFYRLLEKMRP